MTKILLVEDDADLSDTLKDWLECQGYSVETAFNGPDALSGMKSNSFDVIVLDWQLPDMAGVDVCRQYRAAGGKDFILMLTGNRDVTARQAGLEAGANDFLPKPFNLDQLGKRIHQLLNDR
jgi:DNA-binding response OmpR family regulator